MIRIAYSEYLNISYNVITLRIQYNNKGNNNKLIHIAGKKTNKDNKYFVRY